MIELTVKPCRDDKINISLSDERHWSDVLLNLDSVHELVKGIGILADATTSKHFLTLCDYYSSDDYLELIGNGGHVELSITISTSTNSIGSRVVSNYFIDV
mgnify:CR=1 FL=1